MILYLLHFLNHEPKCEPVENGVPYYCGRCGQGWVSYYDVDEMGWKWQKIPKEG